MSDDLKREGQSKGNIGDLIRSMRPIQWVKNVFVLAPLVFAKQLNERDPLLRSCLVFGLFCLVSSSVYLLNDIKDRALDARHPVKKYRPIASGRLPLPVASGAMLLFSCVSIALGFWLNPMVGLTLASYVVLNIFYTYGLKRIAYLDIACIASGFLLCVAAGGFAIDVHLSIWLLLCTFMLASLLGLGKRKHELQSVTNQQSSSTRAVLVHYQSHHIDWVLRIAAFVTTGLYIAYTISPSTVGQFGSSYLVWTAPFVLLGLWRYFVLVGRVTDAQSPTDTMVRDPIFVTNILLWAIVVGLIVYWQRLMSVMG